MNKKLMNCGMVALRINPPDSLLSFKKIKRLSFPETEHLVSSDYPSCNSKVTRSRAAMAPLEDKHIDFRMSSKRMEVPLGTFHHDIIKLRQRTPKNSSTAYAAQVGRISENRCSGRK
ncbi:uncharacterized [Tachysurus ichikawai]